MNQTQRLPLWFHQPVPSGQQVRCLSDSFDELCVHTVCQSSHCPNLGRCWNKNTATFMILGDQCTRMCRFCAVSSGHPCELEADEPVAVARAVKKLGLDYAVVTSVTRDDLEDQGATFFVQTIKAIRLLNPGIKVEVLIPDLFGRKELVNIIASAAPEVMAHNIETVKRLTPYLRPQAEYARSLSTLRAIKENQSSIITKSGLMLGLGETCEEIEEAMKDLCEAGCDILTMGQYLAPSKTERHARVERFISPSAFEAYKQKALQIGFKYVLSGPLVRSSYLAKEAYGACQQSMQKSIRGKVAT